MSCFRCARLIFIILEVVLFYRRCISGTKGLSIMLKVVSQMIDAVAGENGKLNFPSVGKFRNII